MAGTLMEITLLYLSRTTPTSPRQAIFATKSSDFALFFRATMILCLSSRIPHVVTTKVGRAKMRSHSCKTWVGIKGIYKPPFLWAEVDITSLLRLIWCPVAGTRCSWHTDPFMSYTDKPDFSSLSIKPSSIIYNTRRDASVWRKDYSPPGQRALPIVEVDAGKKMSKEFKRLQQTDTSLLKLWGIHPKST